jgi:SAM-dependent methyltransferase
MSDRQGSYALRTIAEESELARLRKQVDVLGARELEVFRAGQLDTAGRWLDLGCGPGFVMERNRRAFPAWSLWGCDVSCALATLAAGQGQPVVCASGEALPFCDQMFDGVYARLMLRHVPRPDRILAEMSRVTRAGGSVVLIDTDDATLQVHPEPAGYAEARQRRREQILRSGADPHIGRRLPMLARGAGLEVLSVTQLPLTTFDIGAPAFAKLISPLLEGEEALVELERWGGDPAVFGSWSLLCVVARKS